MEDVIKNKINAYLKEFFLMKRGEIIRAPAEEITLIGDIKMRRVGLKHIVESRRNDGYSLEEIKSMLSRIANVVRSPELDISNTNHKYPKSKIIGKAHPHEDRALLIIYQREKGARVIYNLYYRDINKFKKMK